MAYWNRGWMKEGVVGSSSACQEVGTISLRARKMRSRSLRSVASAADGMSKYDAARSTLVVGLQALRKQVGNERAHEHVSGFTGCEHGGEKVGIETVLRSKPFRNECLEILLGSL